MDYNYLIELLTLYSQLFSTPAMLFTIVFGIVIAFFGFRIYRTFLRPIYALGAGYLTYEILAYFLHLEKMLPDVFGLSWNAAIAIVVAVIAAIIAPSIYKFIAGVAVGLSIADRVIVTASIHNLILQCIVIGFIALIMGLLFRKIFKGVYIFSSSIGGMMSAAGALGILLFPDTFNFYIKTAFEQMLTEAGATAADIQAAFESVDLAAVEAPTSDMGILITAGLIVAGFVVSIVAMVVQTKQTKGR